MAEYAVEQLKVEEDAHHINPTADEIMDSTETKDFASGDGDDLPDHTAVMSSTAGATVGDQEDNDDEGGLFGSGSEDEGDVQSVQSIIYGLSNLILLGLRTARNVSLMMRNSTRATTRIAMIEWKKKRMALVLKRWKRKSPCKWPTSQLEDTVIHVTLMARFVFLLSFWFPHPQLIDQT